MTSSTSHKPKPGTSGLPGRLTPSEIESLRRDSRRSDDAMKKHLDRQAKLPRR